MSGTGHCSSSKVPFGPQSPEVQIDLPCPLHYKSLIAIGLFEIVTTLSSIVTKMLNLTQLLQYYITPAARLSKATSAQNQGEDPKTLLQLLQRAARLWPNHGIAFKDHGWDRKSDFVTYADLLREAEVAIQEWTIEITMLTDARSMQPNCECTRLLNRRSV
jgi:hypothetical protein